MAVNIPKINLNVSFCKEKWISASMAFVPPSPRLGKSTKPPAALNKMDKK
jgi:hypothetical protein